MVTCDIASELLLWVTKCYRVESFYWKSSITKCRHHSRCLWDIIETEVIIHLLKLICAWKCNDSNAFVTFCSFPIRVWGKRRVGTSGIPQLCPHHSPSGTRSVLPKPTRSIAVFVSACRYTTVLMRIMAAWANFGDFNAVIYLLAPIALLLLNVTKTVFFF